MTHSPIDILFKSIFGYLPTKRGQAYEIIAAIVTKILEENTSVSHDTQIRGRFSQTLYQIDVLTEKENTKAFGEVKDYTIKNKKVGRDDIQKLGGALRDLNIDEGLFFSATDFTKPAKQYAEASKDITGKPITLFNLRPSTEKDEEGRIKSIHIDISTLLPNYQDGQYVPIWTADGKSLLNRENTKIAISDIYDSNGNILYTIRELTDTHLGGSINQQAIGCIITPNGHIKIKDKLVPIHGIYYSIPFYKIEETVIIQSDGVAKLLVKSDNGKVDKLVFDTQLSEYFVDDNGKVLKNQGYRVKSDRISDVE
jgi:hypothetical protein